MRGAPVLTRIFLVGDLDSIKDRINAYLSRFDGRDAPASPELKVDLTAEHPYYYEIGGPRQYKLPPFLEGITVSEVRILH
jgi:hypothetical protein